MLVLGRCSRRVASNNNNSRYSVSDSLPHRSLSSRLTPTSKMSLRALRREIFSRRWNLRVFSPCSILSVFTAAVHRAGSKAWSKPTSPRSQRRCPAHLVLRRVETTRSPLVTSRGQASRPNARVLWRVRCGQVGGGSKLSMMPQVNGMRAGRHGVRHVGITVSFSFECPAMCREICLGWYTVVARFFSAFNCSRIPASSTLIKSWRRRFSEIAPRECS